jgi:hypothetical protein
MSVTAENLPLPRRHRHSGSGAVAAAAAAAPSWTSLCHTEPKRISIFETHSKPFLGFVENLWNL